MGKADGFASKVLERIVRTDPRLIEATFQQLLSQKQLLEVIFENLQEGLVVTDPQLRVIVCNARAKRWLGVPSKRRAIGEFLPRLINAPEIFNFIAQTDFSDAGMLERDFRFPRPADFCLQLTSYPVEGQEDRISSIVFVLRDVTAARRLEMQERQAERIASLATLTAGIAHELKNPLNSLQIHAQLANRMVDGVREGSQTVDLEQLEGSLHAVLEETRRMSRIVDDFLGAVRPTDPLKEEVSLRTIIDKVAESFRSELLEKGIVLNLYCDPDIPPILLDDFQIGRALSGIVRNSIEAIETRREEDMDAPPEDLIEVSCRIDGDNVLIEITDNGCGIADEDLKKVFEPHFTTKFSGSGLGLMNVYRIVREHEGKVDIESKCGKGTRLKVRLPLTQRPVRFLTQENPPPPLAVTDKSPE